MSSPRPLVVVGAQGQLGWELVRSLQPVGEVIGLSRNDLDLCDLGAIERVLSKLQPSIICNAAAFTAVDRAESERELALLINGHAPGVIGAVARRLGAAVVHFSTDYVFDGSADRPYRETDRPNPLNVYGHTKLAGEHSLAASGAAQLTVRTSWVYAMRGKNFVRTILALSRERDTLRVVNDQHGTPTWARWLSDAVAQIIGRALRDPSGAMEAFHRDGGVVHLTGAGTTTWHGFAEMILCHDPGTGQRRATTVEAISSEEYPTAARRPPMSMLDGRLAEERFGIRRPDWADQLRLALGAPSDAAAPITHHGEKPR